jgi:hypothetical protein
VLQAAVLPELQVGAESNVVPSLDVIECGAVPDTCQLTAPPGATATFGEAKAKSRTSTLTVAACAAVGQAGTIKETAMATEAAARRTVEVSPWGMARHTAADPHSIGRLAGQSANSRHSSLLARALDGRAQ